MDHRWLGPNSIMKNLGKGLYLIRDDATKAERKVNGAHLKKYYPPKSEEPPTSEEPIKEPPSKCKDVVNISSEGESDGEESDIWVKIGDITLTNEDKRIILEGKWLNDKIIHAAQLLMKNDPDLLPVGSLQNPILSQTYAFDIVSGESVQILHSGKIG